MKKIDFELVSVYKNNKLLYKESAICICLSVANIEAYFQLDTGCPYSFIDEDFYSKFLKAKNIKKHNKLKQDNFFTKEFHYLEDIDFLYKKKLIHKQEYVFLEKNHTKNEQSKIKIHTQKDIPFGGYLGFDFIESKVVEINYIDKQIVFYYKKSIPNNHHLIDIKINKRAVLFNATFNKKYLICLFDTATSNFNIILENSIFKKTCGNLINYEQIIRPDFKLRVYNKTLKKFNIQILNKNIILRDTKVYTNTKKHNNYFFGVGLHNGIIGNSLFKNSKLFLDLINMKAKIEDNIF